MVKQLNFNIVDGNNDYLDLVPTFTELYNDKSIKVAEIKRRLGLTKNSYNQLWKYCKEECLITPRRKPNRKKPSYKTNPKYYSQTRRGNVEYWTITYKQEYFCTCKSVKEAEYVVARLKECNWDKNELPRIRSEYKNEP